MSGSYLKTTDEVDFATLAQNWKEAEPNDQQSSFSRTLRLESRTTNTYCVGNSKINTAAMAVEKTNSIVAPGENDINAKAELGHVHSLQVSAISDTLDEQEEKKLLKKIDLWYCNPVDEIRSVPESHTSLISSVALINRQSDWLTLISQADAPSNRGIYATISRQSQSELCLHHGHHSRSGT